MRESRDKNEENIETHGQGDAVEGEVDRGKERQLSSVSGTQSLLKSVPASLHQQNRFKLGFLIICNHKNTFIVECNL